MDFLEEELQEILKIFREESEEYLQKLNQNLLTLETDPYNNEIISELFREAHSLKGAARMIGLNDIQAVAHKIEDVFGLAREKALVITPDIIDILCKAVDCISSVIDECIESRGQSHSSNVDEMIAELEKVKNSSGETKTDESEACLTKVDCERPEIHENLFELEDDSIVKKIHSLIEQAQAIIDELKEYTTNTPLICDLYRLIVVLDEHSQKIPIREVKEIVNNVKIKLDSVVRGSGILLEIELHEMESCLGEIFEYLPSTTEKPDINIIDNNSSIQESADDLDYISNNIILLSGDCPLEVIESMVNKLQSINQEIEDENVKKIFEKIIEFIEFLKNEGTKPSYEIAEVLKQSFDTACLMLSAPSNSIIDDPSLIFQRISILYQMLKISDNELMSQKEEFEDVSEVTASAEFVLADTKKEIFPTGEAYINNPLEEVKQGQSTTIKTIRVDTQKLDQLVNQVGELIIAKIKAKEHLADIEKISSFAEDWYREWGKAKKIIKYIDKRPVRSSEIAPGTSVYSQNKNIFAFFEESSQKLTVFMNKINALYKTIQEDDTRLNLLVNDLEEGIKSVRVLPLATIFHMFPRMVRDIAREKSREIDFIISGSETSVDKKILEEIKSPLIHIIRNAIDHGIEDPEERIKLGKNPIGKIALSAYHLENSVLIEISDDGQGINLDAIKNKVLQKGLLTPSEIQAMNDEQIMNIIFWPGFSTGDTITNISGRGIGLDIVYTKIAQLSGKVYMKSAFGQGCTVSIQLPVTMATVKSFLVKVNEQTFAIPTSSIKKTLLISPKDIIYKEGKENIFVDDKIVPICSLSRILEMKTTDSKVDDKVVIIVVEGEDVQVGFIVEKLLGDQEILHKNLTAPLLRVRNVAGVTTLGSGELCIILNINDIVKSAYYIFGMGRKELIINREPNSSFVQKNILVVDDSVTTRILERNILRAAGYNVTVAINGLDALTKLFSQEFDLVVTDVEMPEINGFELTERIRSDERFKNIPIILLTSLASDSDKKRGLSLGADTYITKGYFDQEELLSTIRRLLANKSG